MRNDEAFKGYEIDLEILSDKNASIAVVSLCDNARPLSNIIRHTGSAKREPGDKYDRTIGEQLATARALKSLARELEHAANKSVNRATLS